MNTLRRHTIVTMLGLLVLGLLAAGVAAQEETLTGNDPLSFSRVDPEADAVPLTVRYQATGETREVMGRYLLAGSQEMYVRSANLAAVLKAGRYWQGALRYLELKVANRLFRMTAGSRVVISDEGEVLLPVPVLDHEGDLWLPMVFVEQVVGPQTRERVAWDPDTRRLDLGSAEFNVSRLEVEVLGRTTAVHIFTTEPLGYRHDSPRSGVIEVKIYGGEINAASMGLSTRRGLVRSVSSRQHRDFATVTINVDQLVGRFHSYTADRGARSSWCTKKKQSRPCPILCPWAGLM